MTQSEESIMLMTAYSLSTIARALSPADVIIDTEWARAMVERL